MPDHTLLEALRACAIVFPSGILTVVGKTDGGSPVSVPLGDGATREAIAALAALEARPLLEPHALEIAIRERDDARAKVDCLAHEVSVNRDTIEVALADYTASRALLERERRMRGETRLDLVEAQDDRDEARAALSEANAEVERARTAATDAVRARMAAVDAQAAAEEARERAAESMDKLAKQWTEAWTRAEAAEARAKALDGDAVPFEWGIFSPAPDDRLQESFATKDEAEADLEYYPKGFVVFPLYRHPPKPAGRPIVWAIVFSDGFANTYQTEADARRSYSCGKGRLVPLYEATPSGCVDHGPDGVGC